MHIFNFDVSHVIHLRWEGTTIHSLAQFSTSAKEASAQSFLSYVLRNSSTTHYITVKEVSQIYGLYSKVRLLLPVSPFSKEGGFYPSIESNL